MASPTTTPTPFPLAAVEIIDEKEITQEPKHEVHNINDNITLYIGDSIDIKKKLENQPLFRMIYFDPPFNSNRDYNLNCHSNLGFSDKWI